MKFSQYEIPSNRKFGYFFTFVFALMVVNFYFRANVTLVYIFAVASISLLLITLIKADVLLPVNKLWMRFGLLLGMLVSPIVLGVIFFVLFTPIAIVTRLIGRDELFIKFDRKESYWRIRSESVKSESFNHQY